MKFVERFGKTVRAVITIPERNIDHPFISTRQRYARERQAAAADVFPQRVSSQNAEYPLKVEAG